MSVLRTISLGWGVQSWTLAAMVALKELPPVDYAIHADTTWEASGTYEHARKWTTWLEDRGVSVITVQDKRAEVVASWSNSVSVNIPAFTVDKENGSEGQIRRQCTHDWKIMPIRKFLRDKLKEAGEPARPGVVETLLGISLDEYTRMRDSDVAYIRHAFPLVDARLTRADCVLWLERQGLPVPPKSACVFCPYKSITSWKELKQVGGKDWETAVAVDKAIRGRRPKVDLFVHPGRRSLPEAVRIPQDYGAEQLAFPDIPCDGGYCFF